jgi:hypothetical protein
MLGTPDEARALRLARKRRPYIRRSEVGADNLLWRAAVENRQPRQPVEQGFDCCGVARGAQTRRARQALLNGSDHRRIDVFAGGGGELARRRIGLWSVNF